MISFNFDVSSYKIFVGKKKRGKERKKNYILKRDNSHSIAEKKIHNSPVDGEKKNKHITFSLDSGRSQKKSTFPPSRQNRRFKRYLERNGRTMTLINLWTHLSECRWLDKPFALFHCDGIRIPVLNGTAQEAYFHGWPADLGCRSNSIQFLFYYLANPPRTRCAIVSLFGPCSLTTAG